MVRRNTEQQLDALIDPVRARVQQLESQMSADPRDPLTAEYTKAKNMLNAYETIRDNRLREIDKMYGMAYTENQESRASWNEENRTKWREQYGGGEDNNRGRWDGRKALYTGEQSATNNGQLRETQIRDQSQIGARWKTGYSESGGQAVYTSDSEGREIGEQQFEQLRNTAIRTPEGRPIAVYHSTPNMDFTEFAKGDTGFHFGNEAQAQKRGRDKNIENGRMFRAYLDIKNPIYVKSDIMNWKPYALSFRLYNDGIINQSEYDKIQSLTAEGQDYDSPASVELRRMLENKGYDGVVYPNGYEAGDSYMAFRPDQIITTDIYNIANGKFPSINHQASEDSGAFSMPESGERGGKIMEESVGAAVHDPNSYSALQGRYGTIEPGENPAREIDKMYGMAYTENRESRASWNEENRTKWREQYGGGEAETATDAVYGGRRAAVQRGIFDEGNAGDAAQADDAGRKNSSARTYQQLEGARDEDHGRYRYRFREVGRENASENSLSIADEWTQGGFTIRVYGGEWKASERMEQTSAEVLTR